MTTEEIHALATGTDLPKKENITALSFLESVRALIAKYPALADYCPSVELPGKCNGKGRMAWWSWYDAQELFATYPEFGWTEVQTNIEDPGIDAVATVDGIELCILRIRSLEKTVAQYEPFIPRDLKPENKEFVEAAV